MGEGWSEKLSGMLVVVGVVRCCRVLFGVVVSCVESDASECESKYGEGETTIQLIVDISCVCLAHRQ